MEFKDIFLGLKNPLKPPLMNGGGCVKTVEHVKEMSRSSTGAIIAGSFTVDARDGNSGDVWWYENGVGLNSLGMPNGGGAYLFGNLKEMVTIAHDHGKALVVNIAGFTPDEYGHLAALCCLRGVDAVELNLGCPNIVKEGGGRKPIASYNVEFTHGVLIEVSMVVKNEFPVWVKFSPIFDSQLLLEQARIVSSYPMVKAVTAINTVPNAYATDCRGKSHITLGLAGLSGAPLKHIGLGQVLQWKNLLPDMPIIAVGGIKSGRDIADYAIVGADAFQMTTHLLRKGKLDPQAIESVLLEYDEL